MAVAYSFFALRAPNYLHSEEHQREIRKMDLEASKFGHSSPSPPTIDATVSSPLILEEIPDDQTSIPSAETK